MAKITIGTELLLEFQLLFEQENGKMGNKYEKGQIMQAENIKSLIIIE